MASLSTASVTIVGVQTKTKLRHDGCGSWILGITVLQMGAHTGHILIITVAVNIGLGLTITINVVLVNPKGHLPVLAVNREIAWALIIIMG